MLGRPRSLTTAPALDAPGTGDATTSAMTPLIAGGGLPAVIVIDVRLFADAGSDVALSTDMPCATSVAFGVGAIQTCRDHERRARARGQRGRGAGHDSCRAGRRRRAAPPGGLLKRAEPNARLGRNRQRHARRVIRAAVRDHHGVAEGPSGLNRRHRGRRRDRHVGRRREREVRDRHVVIGVALRPRGVAGEQRPFGEIGVVARDGIAPDERGRHGVHEDVIERLRRSLEHEAVALRRRQRVGQVDEVGIDEVGALVHDDLIVGRRRPLDDRRPGRCTRR